MFSQTYKFIGMVIVILVLLGHHSFQVQAMNMVDHQNGGLFCVGHDCHQEVKVEICEKIQSDKIQVSNEVFILSGMQRTLPFTILETQITPDEILETYRERIPLSQKQLARSHLTKHDIFIRLLI